ncbi:hypothetical protein [Halostella litorea]|uniref:hypothetical protein n=1 Tax=Halostella litorea TaxID=2528831 RepID=UPI0010929B21|nr:hypothetical protein [Halostella litorea]
MDDSETPVPAAADGPDFAGDPPAPLSVLADAVEPLRATLQQVTGAFGLPEPAMLVEDVLATPPDERFARCARRYAEQFGDGALLSDPERLAALADDLPIADPVGRAVRVVVRITGQLEGELLAAASEVPADAEPYLVLAVAARRLRELALDVGETFDAGGGAEGDLAHLLSATLALTARLLELAPGDVPTADGAAEGEADDESQPDGRSQHDTETADLDPEDWLDTVARDVVRAGYHRESAMGATPSTVPAAKSDAEVRRIVRLRGAAAAADVLDLDPAGAAALVDEPAAAVETLLDRRG